MLRAIPKRENRTYEQIRSHYEIEKELAGKLRNADKKERRHLYTAVYDELFSRVPLHSQLTHKSDPAAKLKEITRQIKFLKRFLWRDTVYLEVGAGDCSLSVAVSKMVKKVYVVDVSTEITKNINFPENCVLAISDGTSIPVPKNSVDVAYSNQLMEHLHPDDAFEQIQNIYTALKREGAYICITPNSLTGPHDISRGFDGLATGFHLKEYTATELSRLFFKVGFSKVYSYIGGRGIHIRCPLLLIILCEKTLRHIPALIRLKLTDALIFKSLLGVRMVAVK